ncbi:MAG: chromate transporter [Burkholderiaceae bacterium]
MSEAQWHGLLALFSQFASLSLLAIGGAISVIPDLHRYLVDETALMSTPQFNASIALAQAAPGPNVLFVALMGCYSGLTIYGVPGQLSLAHGSAALWGTFAAMLGFFLPGTVLTLSTTGWLHRHRQHPAVRAFKAGLAPVAVALTLSTAWLLLTPELKSWLDWPMALLALVALLLVLTTRTHLLLVMGLGALAGALIGV